MKLLPVSASRFEALLKEVRDMSPEDAKKQCKCLSNLMNVVCKQLLPDLTFKGIKFFWHSYSLMMSNRSVVSFQTDKMTDAQILLKYDIAYHWLEGLSGQKQDLLMLAVAFRQIMSGLEVSVELERQMSSKFTLKSTCFGSLIPASCILHMKKFSSLEDFIVDLVAAGYDMSGVLDWRS